MPNFKAEIEAVYTESTTVATDLGGGVFRAELVNGNGIVIGRVDATSQDAAFEQLYERLFGTATLAGSPVNIISGQTTGDAPLALHAIPIADDTASIIQALIVGRDAGDGVSGTYALIARVSRTLGGSATLGLNSPDNRHTDEGDLTWNATITVSGNDAIIQVTGEDARTINWTAAIILCKAA